MKDVKCPKCKSKWNTEDYCVCPYCDFGHKEMEEKKKQQHTFFKYGGNKW